MFLNYVLQRDDRSSGRLSKDLAACSLLVDVKNKYLLYGYLVLSLYVGINIAVGRYARSRSPRVQL